MNNEVNEKDNIYSPNLISIIVPVYNVEKYLCRSIESILQQSYTYFEVILVNDGSTDSSLEICYKYSKIDSRIRVFDQENKGVSAARNVGLDNVRGDYICFVDADDYIYPDYLRKLIDSLINCEAEISVCGSVHFVEKIDEKIKNNFENIYEYSGKEACKRIYDRESGHGEFVVPWGKLYKRQLFQELRYPVGRIHEDQFLTYKLMYNAKKVVEIGECLYAYYKNMNGIMRSPFSNKRYDDIVACEEAISFFKEKKEIEVENMVRETKQLLLARYSIIARREKVYKFVPKEYKIGFFKAVTILEELLGVNNYEYYMAQYYPDFVKMQSYLRKIKNVREWINARIDKCYHSSL